MKRDINEAIGHGHELIGQHPEMDLMLSDIDALYERQSRDITRLLYESYLAGLSIGYRNGIKRTSHEVGEV